eukprot:6069199-Pleurochrysis_carterae.AAC.1
MDIGPQPSPDSSSDLRRARRASVQSRLISGTTLTAGAKRPGMLPALALVVDEQGRAERDPSLWPRASSCSPVEKGEKMSFSDPLERRKAWRSPLFERRHTGFSVSESETDGAAESESDCESDMESMADEGADMKFCEASDRY